MQEPETTSPSDAKSWQLSLVFCTLVVIGFLYAFEPITHWFVIPVWFCGVLMGRDAMDWFRGRLSLFNPAGVIGLLGVHFFFLAPLLHVAWNSWMPYVERPADWRDWLGIMALFNAVGLLAYGWARRAVMETTRQKTAPKVWELNEHRLVWALLAGLAVSAALQCWVYASLGGIGGYIQAVTESIGADNTESAMAGMGWIFMVSETFPILAMILYAVWARRRPAAGKWAVIVAVLAGYFVLKMLFGGLRGSRSNTVWGLFWAVGIVHLWVRPISRKFVLVGVCFLVAFMYFYGFYKGLGHRVLDEWQGSSLSEMSKKSGRSFDGVLLGDLGRADVQAFLVHRLWRTGSDYRYAWGRTYAASAALLVPGRFWPDKPPLKVKDGTDAIYGAGTFAQGQWHSSHVYGIAGEAILNFGPFAVPVAYLLFGLSVGWLQRFLTRLSPADARLLLYPFLVNTCFSILVSDSDNLIFNFIKDGIVPLSIIWYGARIVAVPAPTLAWPAPAAQHA